LKVIALQLRAPFINDDFFLLNDQPKFDDLQRRPCCLFMRMNERRRDKVRFLALKLEIAPRGRSLFRKRRRSRLQASNPRVLTTRAGDPT
jgi:hypothetical protein